MALVVGPQVADRAILAVLEPAAAVLLIELRRHFILGGTIRGRDQRAIARCMKAANIGTVNAVMP
jgi:hypothetical protein